MLNALVAQAKQRGLTSIIGYYLKTKKNKMVSDLYQRFDFEELRQDEHGNSDWRLDLRRPYSGKEHFIEAHGIGNERR